HPVSKPGQPDDRWMATTSAYPRGSLAGVLLLTANPAAAATANSGPWQRATLGSDTICGRGNVTGTSWTDVYGWTSTLDHAAANSCTASWNDAAYDRAKGTLFGNFGGGWTACGGTADTGYVNNSSAFANVWR